MLWQISFMRVSGAFGKLCDLRRLSGILIVSAFNILSKLLLFSPASNKKLVSVMASGLFPVCYDSHINC